MKAGKPSSFYVVVSDWAMFHEDARDLEASDRFVLIAMAFHGRTCTAGKVRLARLTGFDPKTCSTATRRLEARGFLSRPCVPPRGKPSVWTVAPHLKWGRGAPTSHATEWGRSGGGVGAFAPPNSEQGTDRGEEDSAPQATEHASSSTDPEEEDPMTEDPEQRAELRQALELIDAATEQLEPLYFASPTFDQRERAAQMLTRTVQFQRRWLTTADVAGSCVERAASVRKWEAFFGTDKAVRATAEAACRHRRRRENPAAANGHRPANVPSVDTAKALHEEFLLEEEAGP